MQENDQVSPPNQNQLAHFIAEQIEAPVNCLLKGEHIISAAKLILSGIDLMGYLTLPADDHKVVPSAFKQWVNDYMEMVQKGEVSAGEIWKTRCDLLHAHGYRDHAEDNPHRYIIFCELSTPPAYDEGDVTEYIHISIEKFLKDFLDGVHQCISHLYGEKDRAIRTQNRLEHVQYVRRDYLTWDDEILLWDGEPVTWDRGVNH